MYTDDTTFDIYVPPTKIGSPYMSYPHVCILGYSSSCCLWLKILCFLFEIYLLRSRKMELRCVSWHMILVKLNSHLVKNYFPGNTHEWCNSKKKIKIICLFVFCNWISKIAYLCIIQKLIYEANDCWFVFSFLKRYIILHH